MSKLIPIACLALLGTAGPAWAQSGQTSDPIQQVNVNGARSVDTGTLVQSAATAARTYTTLGIRYEMKM